MSDLETRIQVSAYSEFRRIPLPRGAILITSALSKEGKTLVATTLAIAESFRINIKKKTLFIDLTYNRHGGTLFTDEKNAKGIAEILTKKATVKECIRQTTLPDKLPNLYVLPFGNAPDDFEPIVHLSDLQDLIKTLSDEYRIIIDSVPVFLRNRGNFDPVELSQIVTTTFIVVLAGKTPMEAIQKSKTDIETSQGNVSREDVQKGKEITPKRETNGGTYGTGSKGRIVGVILNDQFSRPILADIALYLGWLEKKTPLLKNPIAYIRARFGIYG